MLVPEEVIKAGEQDVLASRSGEAGPRCACRLALTFINRSPCVAVGDPVAGVAGVATATVALDVLVAAFFSFDDVAAAAAAAAFSVDGSAARDFDDAVVPADCGCGLDEAFTFALVGIFADCDLAMGDTDGVIRRGGRVGGGGRCMVVADCGAAA